MSSLPTNHRIHQFSFSPCEMNVCPNKSAVSLRVVGAQVSVCIIHFKIIVWVQQQIMLKKT